jgi:hypothetical protein
LAIGRSWGWIEKTIGSSIARAVWKHPERRWERIYSVCV